jgi:hypothetical protein
MYKSVNLTPSFSQTLKRQKKVGFVSFIFSVNEVVPHKDTQYM